MEIIIGIIVLWLLRNIDNKPDTKPEDYMPYMIDHFEHHGLSHGDGDQNNDGGQT